MGGLASVQSADPEREPQINQVNGNQVAGHDDCSDDGTRLQGRGNATREHKPFGQAHSNDYPNHFIQPVTEPPLDNPGHKG